MRVEGTVCWVTGASSGIGEAVARVLLERGARVVVTARRADVLERLRRDAARPDAIAVVAGDLEDGGERDALVARAIAAFGHVDAVIHAAGISQRSLAADTDPAVDRRLMELNYFAVIAITKAILPHMLRRGRGHLTAVSSIAGKTGVALRSGYAGSKHALHGFFDALRAELAGTGIEVLVACPGFVDTPLASVALTGDGSPHGRQDEANARGLTPRECAERIVRAIERSDHEAYIGGREVLGVYLKRFAPRVLERVLRRYVTK
jgi:short-subunit dehydrogenase